MQNAAKGRHIHLNIPIVEFWHVLTQKGRVKTPNELTQVLNPIQWNYAIVFAIHSANILKKLCAVLLIIVFSNHVLFFSNHSMGLNEIYYVPVDIILKKNRDNADKHMCTCTQTCMPFLLNIKLKASIDSGIQAFYRVPSTSTTGIRQSLTISMQSWMEMSR